MSKDAYTLTSPDGTTSELPIRKGTMGPAVIDISKLYREQGVFTYDAGFVSTGSCDSDITFIDGEKGVLMYRGYRVERLAAESNFIEVAYLLLYGELPTADQLATFNESIRRHTMLINPRPQNLIFSPWLFTSPQMVKKILWFVMSDNGDK